MCTHYRIRSTGSSALAAAYHAAINRIGNVEIGTDFYPDRLAPIIRATDDARELSLARWGFPPPPIGGPVVVNVRNLSSPFWRPWLKIEHRCLVPFDSFSEWTMSAPKVQKWFTTPDEAAPAFAGIWRPWTGVRGTKKEPVDGDHTLFAFLTTEPNEVVAAVHPKAMPVVLREGDWQRWLEADWSEAKGLQRTWHGEMGLYKEC